jgi:hypothetical protein
MKRGRQEKPVVAKYITLQPCYVLNYLNIFHEVRPHLNRTQTKHHNMKLCLIQSVPINAHTQHAAAEASELPSQSQRGR